MENKQNHRETPANITPDGVALLMENLWLRHRAGIRQRQCKVYMVDLPPLTDDELREVREPNEIDYGQEELFGGFV